MEISMEVLKKTKSRPTIGSRYIISIYSKDFKSSYYREYLDVIVHCNTVHSSYGTNLGI